MASEITQPPIRLYGFDTAPDKIVGIDPAGGTSRKYKVKKESDGWYCDVAARYGGRDALVYRQDDSVDIVRVPTMPGSALDCSQGVDNDPYN